MDERSRAWRQLVDRLHFGPPIAMPAIDSAELAAIRLQPPGRIIAWDKGYELPPLTDMVSERAAQILDSFYGWLEPRLEEAFAEGMDYAVTRVEGPDDRPQPKYDPDALAWTYTMSWRGQMVPPGTSFGPNWTVYHRPEGWRPGWRPDR